MKTIIQPKYIMVLLVTLLFLSQACNTSRSVKGGAVGAAAGGTIGGLIGNNNDNTAAGIIIGAAVGGAAGVLIGGYMDKQAKEIEEEVEGVEVERVGEGILLTFDSGLLFGFDSYELSPTTRENLNELAGILETYEGTQLVVEGHTDSKGSKNYNMNLSKQRANAVADYLAQQGVQRTRFTINGWGEEHPTAENNVESGRKQNRRVEVAVYANEELKQEAASGKIDTKAK